MRVENIRISHEEYISGKYGSVSHHTESSQNNAISDIDVYEARVYYKDDGTIDEMSYSTQYKKKLHGNDSNNNATSNNNSEQRESVGGFFAKVLLRAALESEEKGKKKPVTKHAKKPAPQKPGEPKAIKKPAPTPKRQIGKPVVNKSSIGISTGGSSIGSVKPKKKLFSGTKPVKAKPIKPTKPVASASKKRAIAKGSTTKTSSIHTTTKKSGGMFGGSTKKSSTPTTSRTTTKKSGGMFGGSTKKSSGIGIMGGKKRK